MTPGNQHQPTDRAADMMTRIGQLYDVTTTGASPTPLHTFTCHRCHRTWKQERAAPPSLCPCCGYARWAEPREGRRCARCGHEWDVPNGHPHGKCPNCHSRQWDTPPKRG